MNKETREIYVNIDVKSNDETYAMGTLFCEMDVIYDLIKADMVEKIEVDKNVKA